MRPGDIPSMKTDSLASMVRDGPDEASLRDVALVARIEKIRSAFAAVKKIHLLIALACADNPRTSAAKLRKLAARLDKVKLPQGFSRQSKRAINDIISSVEETAAGSKSSTPNRHTRQLLLDLKAAYKKAKADRAQVALIGVSAAERDLQLLQERASKILKETSKERVKLESLGTKPYTIARVPVVPVYQGYVNIDRAYQAGIHVESLGGYALVHNQMVIGISRTAVEEIKKGKMKSKQFLDTLLPSLEKATGKKLYLVSDKGEHAAGGMWYWVADAATLNALQNNVIGKSKLLGWGFGF